MEPAKDLRFRGQCVTVTPAKPIPIKRPQPILSPDWFESIEADRGFSVPRIVSNNSQMGALPSSSQGQIYGRSEFNNDGLAQIPYKRLLEINDPAIERQTNLVNFMLAQSGGGVGGRQETNVIKEEATNWSQLLHGNNSVPSNREDVNRQFLPSYQEDINGQFLTLHREDVNRQFLPSYQEDVNSQCMPLNHKDVSSWFMPPNRENVNNSFMHSNNGHVKSRRLPPLAPKPQYKQPLPFLPNLNSLPEINMASAFVSEAMSSPVTPASMEKNQRVRIHNHIPHEIIDLESDAIADNHLEQCTSNQVEPSPIITSQHQEGDRNPIANSHEELAVQETNGENQNIDLNNTPQQQKQRRRKYTPKVIREGKPARTPKPATPKPATTTENPSGKRKYVRKNKGINTNPLDTPSTTLKESVNPDSQCRSKPVRRSLNFDLEDPQVIDRSSESQIREANTAAEIMLSSSQRPALAAMASLRGFGVGIDLNSSTNQIANENLRVPQTPIQPPQLSRQEMMKAKWREEFKRMVHNMTPSLQSTSRRESANASMQGTKRDYNLVNNAQAPENSNSMHSNDIHKKMRIENGQKEPPSNSSYTWTCTPDGWRILPWKQNPSKKVLTFADARRAMALEKMRSLKSMLLFNQLQRQASERQAQVHSQTSRSTHNVSARMAYCNQPSTPQKAPDAIHGPRARVEALVAHQMKSKAGRPRKKVDPPVNSTVTNVARRENVPETSKIGSSPINSNNYKPSGVLVSYRDPVDYIVRKLRNLNINGGEEVVADQPQNALVPYVGGVGAMVPFDGPFNILKKRKPRPKVDLDPESDRVWKLLMGKEDEGEQGTSVDKEKWWEEERRVFRGRADSFIARMHLIQGDRRFSRWKGSVVDSVIGVFLTQNVSDHLSSSAFMSLAARFPPKSRGNNTSANAKSTFNPIVIIDRHESLESNTGVDSSKECSLDFHEIELGKGHESPDSVLGNAATLTSCTSTVDGEERKSLEDVVSSQNSIESSQSSSECPGHINHLLNFEADELLNGGRGNGFNSFTELLQMANDRTLQDPKITGNVIDWSQNDFSNLPYNHSNFLNSGFVGVENGNLVINESNRSYLPPYPFELNNARHYGSSAGSSTTENSTAKIASRIDSCVPISHNINQPITIQSEKHSCCQSEASSKKIDSSVWSNQQREAQVQMERTQRAVETPNSHSDNRKNNFVDAGAAESNSRNGTHMSRKVLDEAKKAKADAEKTKTFDWDSLRRQVYQKNAKKEHNSDAMDSLDYKAVREADVSEISHTIRERGMNNLLAERIKEFLNRLVRDHGSIDLEWLRDVPPDKAKDYLLSIRGLGLKSVECVRLLTLHHLAFPVDTNVGRIAVRLGWVPLQPLPESLQLHLLEMYPILETIQKYLWPRLCKLDQRTLYELHYQLITFGKVFCTKSKPNCNSCPMRVECKHFASAYASARLALPGPEEKHMVSSSTPRSSEQTHGQIPTPMPLPQLEGFMLRQEQTASRNCEPIIEEPETPEPECIETSEIDIEDAFYNDPDEIPTIKLNYEEFSQNLQNYMQENSMGLQDGDMSKALVAVSPELASIPAPKLKNVSRLRTEHLVYELPDSHPLLEGLDKREPDDPCPYLLAIWAPGETAQSTEPPKACCNTQDSSKSCGSSTCFSCNSIREAQAQTVRGTILIPCRTANRGSFPLNGTYFQVNEVFADHDSSCNPIDVSRNWIWNLPRRTVYFGTSIPSIFKGLTTEGIQHCFWRGFVCVRGFDRTMRAPKPLFARLHFPASKVTRNKKTAEAVARQEE